VPECTDGVFFVDLSPVRNPALVPAAVATALTLAEQPGLPAAEVVTAHLRNRDLLLVLDNFEQVTDAGVFVGEVLAAAAGLRVLATSRVPLHVHGEQEFAVPPLGLPDPRQPTDPENLGRYEAVALFVQRASAVRAGFRLTEENAPAVAEIAARLDGLPLAIELAASRVKLLPPRQLLPRLERRLALLTSAGHDLPERQRTLRATLDWSHDLLPEPERRLFRRLAVFAGGADLGAVEAVADPDGELGDTLDLLATLVDDNLVQSLDDPGDEPRFGMLETIREYGLDQLSRSGEGPIVQRRHAEHWLGLAERTPGSLTGADHEAWLSRLDRDLDNVRAALDWTVDGREAELGLRLAAALDDYWRLGSHVREGVSRLSQLLALEQATGRTRSRARALTVLSGLHGWIDDPDRMIAAAEEASAIYRDLGDDAGLAAATDIVGWAQLQLGRLEPAKANLTEAIDRHLALGHRNLAARAMPALGLIAQFQGNLREARRHFEAALAGQRDSDDQFMAAMTECMIGGVDQQEGDLEAAVDRILGGLSGFLRIRNDMGVSWVLFFLADLALERGQPVRALRLIGASDRLRGGTELPSLVTTQLGDVGGHARRRLDDVAASNAYRQGADLSLDDAVAYARGQRAEDAWDDCHQGPVARRAR
jgi:predicted ATPase